MSMSGFGRTIAGRLCAREGRCPMRELARVIKCDGSNTVLGNNESWVKRCKSSHNIIQPLAFALALAFAFALAARAVTIERSCSSDKLLALSRMRF